MLHPMNLDNSRPHKDGGRVWPFTRAGGSQLVTVRQLPKPVAGIRYTVRVTNRSGEKIESWAYKTMTGTKKRVMLEMPKMAMAYEQSQLQSH